MSKQEFSGKNDRVIDNIDHFEICRKYSTWCKDQGAVSITTPSKEDCELRGDVYYLCNREGGVLASYNLTSQSIVGVDD